MMYHAALPVQLVLAHMMNNLNNTQLSGSVAAFYTGCADLVQPQINASGNNDSDPNKKYGGYVEWNYADRSTPSTSSNRRTSRDSGSKVVKSRWDQGLLPHPNSVPYRVPMSANRTRLKRRADSDHGVTDSLPNGQVPPPQKKAFVRSSSPVMKLPHHTPAITNGSEWDYLSEEIWQKYVECKQSDEVFSKKMRLLDAVQNVLQETYSYCILFVVGSSMNGFGCNNSDMDLCLMFTNDEINQKFEATTILKNVYRILRKCSFIRNLELIKAKVPIIKFVDNVSGIEVDFNVNNVVGIRNTHLLKCYSKLDWRVCPLILIIKMWAKQQDINDAKLMTISSYSIALMVIHYLQCGAQPPVLPCLHKVYPHKFLSTSDVCNLNLNEELPPHESRNQMSLGELLVDFLDYYSNRFNFQREAMSIRTGSKLPKITVQLQSAQKNNPGQWKCLSIEEPFDLTNTARSVYNENVFRHICLVFKRSWQILRQNKHLASILQKIM